jgi:hypothetical protein
MAVGDPEMALNTVTGRYRIVLRDGEPSMSDRPDYPILSMLFEDAGWPMEETPREGSLRKEFPESGINTPTLFKAAVERRLLPILDSGDIVAGECTDVRVLRRQDGTAIASNIQYQQPGRPEESPRIEVIT